MRPADTIERLARPGAYPDAVDRVEVRQTHISVVFLAGPWVYKVKKPVRFDFLDFSTPAARRFYCEEEVRLNRRLTTGVYEGVVPVVADGDSLRFEGDGEPVEWAVKMRRLPDDATLSARLKAGAVDAALLNRLAGHVAAFHRDAAAAPAEWGRSEAVAANVSGVLRQAAAHAGLTVEPALLEQLSALFDAELVRRRPLIEARAARGVVRDAHGDLHLGHVYHFPERPPPGDFVIVDCVEFSARLRALDPVADAAFLVMDLAYHGRRDLAGAFAAAYAEAAGDAEGAALVPLYSAYRACVRGLVEGLKGREPEVGEDDRRAALASARAHWLLAADELH